MKTNVLIIGAGELGQTLVCLLESNPTLKVQAWDKNPEKCTSPATLDTLIPQAEVILYAAPAAAAHELISKYAGHLQPHTLWYSFAKGIDPHSHRYLDTILECHLPDTVSWAIVGGPILAEELELGRGGVMVVGSHYSECLQGLRHLFRYQPSVRFAKSNDPHGVAISGTLKNVYALFLGLIDGLGAGQDMKAFYTSWCLQELSKLGVLHGAHLPTLLGPAGLGDLLATGSSLFSTNYRAGQSRAAGSPVVLKGEGLQTLPLVVELLGDHISLYPIIQALRDIFISNQDPAAILSALTIA